jgi:predicted RNA-binding Zn ribbon-like protein
MDSKPIADLERTFKFVGGDLAIDFVNTVGGWTEPPPNLGIGGYRDFVLRDKLVNYADLLAWGTSSRQISDDERRRLASLANRFPQKAEEVMERADRLRRALYRVLTAKRANPATIGSDVSVINKELARARENQRIRATGDTFEYVWQVDDSLDRILWPVAVAGVNLLTQGNLARLRQCGGHECGWLFLDTSRNHSRMWCSMDDCGNIAKVRRFRERQTKIDH